MEVRLNDPNKRAGVLLTLKHRREFVGPTPKGGCDIVCGGMRTPSAWLVDSMRHPSRLLDRRCEIVARFSCCAAR